MLSSPPLPFRRCGSRRPAPACLRVDEDEHAELLGLGPERMKLRIGQLLAVDAAADGRAAQPVASSRPPRAARRRGRDAASATEAKATKRSGWAAQTSASFSFWMRISSRATSRSAAYQYGLMLSASTSMPCSSIARRRSAAFDIRSAGGETFRPIRAIASGTAQCACTSTVFTRRPLTTTSRRRARGASDPPLICRAADEGDGGHGAGVLWRGFPAGHGPLRWGAGGGRVAGRRLALHCAKRSVSQPAAGVRLDAEIPTPERHCGATAPDRAGTCVFAARSVGAAQRHPPCTHGMSRVARTRERPERQT